MQKSRCCGRPSHRSSWTCRGSRSMCASWNALTSRTAPEPTSSWSSRRRQLACRSDRRESTPRRQEISCPLRQRSRSGRWLARRRGQRMSSTSCSAPPTMCSKLDSLPRGGRLPSRSDFVPITGRYWQWPRIAGTGSVPVSLQTFGGRPPDRVFQKQTNTFDRRHHVRIWRLPQMVEGRPVVGGRDATHDWHQVSPVPSVPSRTASRPTSISSGKNRGRPAVRRIRPELHARHSSHRSHPNESSDHDEMTTDGRIAVIVLGRLQQGLLTTPVVSARFADDRCSQGNATHG